MTELAPIVHVIDDDDSVRQAVLRLLGAAGHAARGYANAGEFLIAAPDPSQGCLILDVRMPGPGGLELQAALKKQGNHLPVIFLTGHGDIPMSVQAIKAGAVDFLTKPVQGQALLDAVRNALQINQADLQKRQRTTFLQACLDTLSDREKDIFRLVVQGKLNKQIAATLGIAERTVKAHRAQVMEKMQAQSFAELVRIASEVGLEVA